MSAELRRTEDGRYIVIGGRRWRTSDPGIPQDLESELVSELMRARRLIKTTGNTARPRVHEAKIALGERGEPWWEPTVDGRRRRAEAAINTLLRVRGGGRVSASEAARIVGGAEWADLVPLVEALIDDRAHEQHWVRFRSIDETWVHRPSDDDDE